MITPVEESEAEYFLDVLLADKNRPYGSKVEKLDVALTDKARNGEEVEESKLRNNMFLNFDDSPTFESCLGDGTPSPGTEALQPETPTASGSASPLIFEQSAPGSREEQISDAVDYTGPLLYLRHCPSCNMDFKLEKDLRRHFKTAWAHRLSSFQCCCKLLFGRKENFRNHIKRGKPCDTIVPFLCSCRWRVDSGSPDSISLILEHIGPCGQRKRGRPKKSYPL
ncbi:hypothetical protein GGI43DRAFT_403200 [Trichoderma evansii]